MFAVSLAHGCQQSFGAGFGSVAVISCDAVTALVFFTWPVCFCQPAAAAAKAMLVWPLLQFFKRTPSRPEGSLMRDAGADTCVARVGPVHARPHTRGDPSARVVQQAPSWQAAVSQIREPFARILFQNDSHTCLCLLVRSALHHTRQTQLGALRLTCSSVFSIVGCTCCRLSHGAASVVAHTKSHSVR